MKERFALATRNELMGSENEVGVVAGFWRGFWHGVIAPIAFIVSLFNENVGVYETHNAGTRYNLGFVLGIMIVGGGSRQGSAKKKVSDEL